MNYLNKIISSPFFYALTSLKKNKTSMILISGQYLHAFSKTRSDIDVQIYMYVKQQSNYLINSFKNVNFLFKDKSK